MDYQEKLRLAKEALDSGSYDKKTIEYIFPELKQSEDEEIRKQLIDFIEDVMDLGKDANFNKYYKSDCAGWIAWLKSLKEKYTWKPKEEWMKALDYVINLMASSESPTENDYYYNVFKDMRTHLKKLKEE